jgi:hypothetical protein
MLKRVIGTAIVVAVLTALWMVLFTAKPAPVQTFHLADGSLVSLAAVTYGSNQTIVFGKPWQKALYKVLPAGMKHRAKVSAHKFTTTMTETPTFWFFLTNAPAYLWVQPIDEFGCEIEGPESYAMSLANVTPNGVTGGGYVFRYQFQGALPNGKIVGLAMYDPVAKTRKLATILAPGATFVSIPESKFPDARKQAEGLTFELKEFVTRLPCVPFLLNGALTRTNVFTQAVFQVTKDGQPDPGWAVPSLIPIIRDARGEQLLLAVRKQCAGRKEGDPFLNIDGILDPARGPYKITIEFKREGTTIPVEFEATPVLWKRL